MGYIYKIISSVTTKRPRCLKSRAFCAYHKRKQCNCLDFLTSWRFYHKPNIKCNFFFTAEGSDSPDCRSYSPDPMLSRLFVEDGHVHR